MPTKITNTQDVTNFFKDGYVSRTVATRDGANNIKLYEDTLKTTNDIITVEPITSQFSVETALKLFDTRFEYFKFPVQTVAAGSLQKIDSAINEDVSNTLSNISFEQDVITRRMELTPAEENSDVIRWDVPTPWWGADFFALGEVPTYGNSSRTRPYEGEPDDPDTLFVPAYRKAFVDNKLRYSEGYDPLKVKLTGAVAYFGPERIPFTNGNSVKPGWFRVTPEMLSQIRAGGQLKGGSQSSRNPWKRNIKFKLNVQWQPDKQIINTFNGREFIIAEGYVKNPLTSLDVASPHKTWTNFYNGAFLIASLETDPWNGAWRYETPSVDPMAPVFIQSTSNHPVHKLIFREEGQGQNDVNRGLIGAWEPMKNEYQTMTIEYVVDSRWLLQDVDISPNAYAANGEYREFTWKMLGNHPIIITNAAWDISIEELPDDYVSNSSFGYRNERPREEESGDAVWQKMNQFRSYYARYNAQSNLDWVGGVRRVVGRNILAAQSGNTIKPICYTDLDGKWKPLLKYDDWEYKFVPNNGDPELTVNPDLFDAGYFSKRKTNVENNKSYNSYDYKGDMAGPYGFFSRLDTIIQTS